MKRVIHYFFVFIVCLFPFSRSKYQEVPLMDTVNEQKMVVNPINNIAKLGDNDVSPLINLTGVEDGGVTSNEVKVSFSDPQGVTNIKESRYQIDQGDFYHFEYNRRFSFPGFYIIEVEDYDGHVTTVSFTIQLHPDSVVGTTSLGTLTLNCQMIGEEHCVGTILQQEGYYRYTLSVAAHPNSRYIDVMQRVEFDSFPHNYFRNRNLLLFQPGSHLFISSENTQAWMTVIGTEYHYRPNYFEAGGYVIDGQTSVVTKSSYIVDNTDMFSYPINNAIGIFWYTPAVPQDVFDNNYQGYTYQVNHVIYEIRSSMLATSTELISNNYIFSSFIEAKPVFGRGLSLTWDGRTFTLIPDDPDNLHPSIPGTRHINIRVE